MRKVLLLLALFLLVVPNVACSGLCGGTPYATVRWPLEFGADPATAPGPRLMQMPPQWAAPTYQPMAGACMPPGYPIAAPPPVGNPCPPGTYAPPPVPR